MWEDFKFSEQNEKHIMMGQLSDKYGSHLNELSRPGKPNRPGPFPGRITSHAAHDWL